MNVPERVSALPFPLSVDLTMPGSKSHANRAILCACFASGTTIIRNATPCDDVAVMIENLQKMGFDLTWTDPRKDELRIVGGLPKARKEPITLDCHNAGTTLRFLVSLAAFLPGEWLITGDEHMRKRPIGDLVVALRSLGADITETDGCPPLTIRGGKIFGANVRLKASVSSQYLTSLLLIAPLLPHGLSIELDGALASSGYVSLTEFVMNDFGIRIEKKENTFIVHHGEYTAKKEYDIEGDWSAAGAWLVLGCLSGSRFDFTNLHVDSMQSDRKLPDAIRRLQKSGDVTVDCSEIPDQLMNLALLAAFRKGKTQLTGAANLRRKECDRLAVITSEFKKAGIAMKELPDGVEVRGGEVLIVKPITLDPHGDHRMAMCFAVLGLLRGNVTILDPDCTVKSYPDFFGHVRSVRFQSRPMAVVGMRGAGKSNLARRLASRLKLKCLDVDKVFEAKHGPIKEYVAKHGWPDFRAHEERLIAESLQPGVIVSLGGGATESKKTRDLLKRSAIVLWIQATKAELIERLKSGKRPAITGLPLEEEVHTLLVERAPHYKEVAHIMIPPKLPFSRQLPFAVKELRSLVSPQ